MHFLFFLFSEVESGSGSIRITDPPIYIQVQQVHIGIANAQLCWVEGYLRFTWSAEFFVYVLITIFTNRTTVYPKLLYVTSRPHSRVKVHTEH
jgi:hypothetical protein